MNISNLIDHLKMFPDDMEVFIQTTPDDLFSPIARKNFSIMKSLVDERYGHQSEKLILTAYHPKPR